MVYLYRISWRWYEDYEPYVLIHERLFNDKEWNRIIKDAVNKAVKELLETNRETNRFIGMDTIISKVVEILCREHGFRKAEYIQEFSLFGSIVIEEDDEDEIKELGKYIDTKLVNEIIEHNMKIKRKIWRTLEKRMEKRI